jgi:hypothetical protein
MDGVAGFLNSWGLDKVLFGENLGMGQTINLVASPLRAPLGLRHSGVRLRRASFSARLKACSSAIMKVSQILVVSYLDYAQGCTPAF